MLRRALVQPAAKLMLRSSRAAAATPFTAVCRLAAPIALRTNTCTATARCLSTAAAPASSNAADEDTHNDFKPVYKQVLSTGMEDAKRLIEQDIKSHDVFVYMKGSPAQPKCGFSANVCRILNTYPGVKYGSRDVLEDEYIREGIKQFSDWPTLPQLFVKGEFVGGSDIVGNMYKSGELDKLLGVTHNKA